MREVFCLIYGEGELIEEKDGKKIVEFKKGDKKYTMEYNLEGHLINQGKVSPNKVLFDKEPKIVLDEALIDDTAKIIQDKDLIVFGNKENFIWEIGFYDAKNNSIFTKEGYRNPSPIFKKIDVNMNLYKIEHPVLEEKSNKLKDDINTEPVEEASTVGVQDTILSKEANLENNEAKKAELNEFFTISIKEGEVESHSDEIIKLSSNEIKVPAVENKIKIEVSKQKEGAQLFATITFLADKLFKIIKSKGNIRDYLNIIDSCIILKGIQKNLSSSNIIYWAEDNKLFIDFK